MWTVHKHTTVSRETTVRYHRTAITIAEIEKDDSPSAGRNEKHLEFSYTSDGNVKWHTHFRKQFLHDVHNVHIYPQEKKACIYTKAHTPLFIAAFLLIDKHYKQCRGLSTGSWINAAWWNTYSTIKKNELCMHTLTQTNPESSIIIVALLIKLATTRMQTDEQTVARP